MIKEMIILIYKFIIYFASMLGIALGIIFLITSHLIVRMKDVHILQLLTKSIDLNYVDISTILFGLNLKMAQITVLVLLIYLTIYFIIVCLILISQRFENENITYIDRFIGIVYLTLIFILLVYILYRWAYILQAADMYYTVLIWIIII